MTDYASQIERIRSARSLDEIRVVAREFSANALKEGGVLYTGPIRPDLHSQVVAKAVAEVGDLSIIDDTARGQFLGDKQVERAIDSSARRIFVEQGQSPEVAKRSAGSFLFGDAKAPANSPISVKNCLWGEASKDFAGSLRGDVKVIASVANVERVLGQVEIPAVLENPRVTTFAGQPVAELRGLYARGGAEAVLPRVQATFIEAAPRGIFVSPAGAAPEVSKVTLSREFAETMEIDPSRLSRFLPAAELAAGAPRRAPIGVGIPAAGAGESAITAEVAATRGLRPGAVAKGAGTVVAAAAVTYDVAATAHDASRLYEQGNATGAESKIVGSVSRNLGALGGVALGAAAGAAVTSETGPGAIIGGVVGGVAGAVGGDRLAAWIDQYRINHQSDRRGNEWSYDPDRPEQGWTRRELDLDAMRYSMGAPVYKPQVLKAGPELADELNFKASNRAIELALSAPPRSQNPYEIPPSAQDRTAPGVRGGDWMRSPETGAWGRTNTEYVDGRVRIDRPESASPERAAQLDRQSEAIIARNAANTPAALAANYQAAYAQYGWSRHGEVPEAVSEAARQPGRVVGSDGDLYQRNARGQWTSDGMLWDSRADGNLLRELEATYRAQQRARETPVTTLEPVTVRPDASITGRVGAAAGGEGRQPPGADGRQASADPQRPRLAPMVEGLGLAALDTPGKVGQVAGSLESAGLRDNVEIQRVAANRDQSVVFGIQGDPATAGNYRQTHVRVAEALAMEPQAIAREREHAQTAARERDAQVASAVREGPTLA